MDPNNNYQQPYQQPYQAPQQPQPSAGLGIASMVTGILSLVLSCCVPYVPFILALLAVIFGGVSLGKKMGGKGMAIAGLVCGIISLAPAVIVLIMGSAIWASLL